MVLHQVKEVGTVTQKEINSECRTLAYIGVVLTILGLVMVTILHYRKSKFCKGHTFCSENHGIHFRYSKLYTYKAMQSSRQHTFIQNYRHTKKLKT